MLTLDKHYSNWYHWNISKRGRCCYIVVAVIFLNGFLTILEGKKRMSVNAQILLVTHF